eukprot:4803955-Prymnesium_polylepis.1
MASRRLASSRSERSSMRCTISSHSDGPIVCSCSQAQLKAPSVRVESANGMHSHALRGLDAPKRDTLTHMRR